MPTALYPLRTVRYAMEDEAGTPVPATTRMYGACTFSPRIDRAFMPTLPNVRVRQTDGGVVTSRSSLLQVSTELDYEQIMLFLSTAFGDPVTAPGGPPYAHSYAADVRHGTGARTATVEFGMADDSDLVYERRFAFGTTARLSIELNRGEIGRVRADLIGRAEEAVTISGTADEIARTTIATDSVEVAIDEDWESLGDTAFPSILRSATLDILTGLTPVRAFGHRPAQDFDYLLQGSLGAQLRITVDHDEYATAEIEAWRDGTKRFVRLSATDGGDKSLQFDLAGYHAAPPRLGRLNDSEVVSFTLDIEYDALGQAALQVQVINDLPGA